ncbi:MAG: MarC family protein [Deltaproteobacteria bacterium]
MPNTYDPFVLSFISMFVAVDAIGNIPLFLSLTEDCNKQQRREVIRYSVATATIVAILFMFIGKWVLQFLGVSIADFQIAGGTLLFFISMRLLLPTTTKGFISPTTYHQDFGVFPLGTPLITGPAVLTTTLVLVQTYGIMPTFISLVLNMIIVAITLYKSNFFTRALGTSGLRAISKIVYILLAAIGVMMIRRGVVSIIQGLSTCTTS